MLRRRKGGPVATGAYAYLPQIRRILQFAIVVATMIVIRHQAPFSFERKGDLPSTSRQTITGSKTTDDNGYSTRIMEATFPLVMVPKSEKKGPDGHFDLMENRDGRYNESKCETWIASGPRHSFACDIEWDEWMLANAFIQPGDVVVEFGARFGTTSCILSRNVGKHGEVISVEPDVTVHHTDATFTQYLGQYRANLFTWDHAAVMHSEQAKLVKGLRCPRSVQMKLKPFLGER
ncbi:hypothetical protein THAOC_13962 [Thalassiosira oceanica]|uniref:Methyltransferase FkbM domain-containing protein n=1 Tax=Thalassiosira oceanica TaxID=159749 RepID=K0SJV0_THAOC|nr:hypothetical protein THAOC_13962 [Thalassiosira oceanica]|eukprot:EJK65209.1 hypothetical protein THAOC_13962 [Thalassiosira oceanica]